MSNNIILVDENDIEIGLEGKLVVHQKGLLHRAFSIFVFNSKHELLIQKRALNKYHSGGLWSNTCCSHQYQEDNETTMIHERLLCEMGFDCQLNLVSKLHYHAECNNGLIENELDRIYYGVYSGKVSPNKLEVCDYKWINPVNLEKEIKYNPNNFTPWLKIILQELIKQSLF